MTTAKNPLHFGENPRNFLDLGSYESWLLCNVHAVIMESWEGANGNHYHTHTHTHTHTGTHKHTHPHTNILIDIQITFESDRHWCESALCKCLSIILCF